MLKDIISLIHKHTTNICILCCILLCLLIFPLTVAGQADFSEFTYGEKDTCEYYLEGTMPVYRRAMPLSTDDPMLFFLAEDEVLPYEYGYVFQDVNAFYQFNWLTRTQIWMKIRMTSAAFFPMPRSMLTRKSLGLSAARSNTIFTQMISGLTAPGKGSPGIFPSKQAADRSSLIK